MPGDPGIIALLGQSLREVANDIKREAGDVEALCGFESWKSKAADAFRETAHDTLEPLRKAYHRYDKAASAMGTRVRQDSVADWAGDSSSWLFLTPWTLRHQTPLCAWQNNSPTRRVMRSSCHLLHRPQRIS
ncbi:hypothetical protein [Streptomyces sp. NPDC001435]|uniref:hypothetical protein n=1 Tax=Streptomyces sp. NPDC001435 TaxID=3364576 RepID=UPI0036769E38